MLEIESGKPLGKELAHGRIIRVNSQTDKLEDIAGQLCFFNETEANCDESASESMLEEIVYDAMKSPGKVKKKGQREEVLKNFLQEKILPT